MEPLAIESRTVFVLEALVVEGGSGSMFIMGVAGFLRLIGLLVRLLP